MASPEEVQAHPQLLIGFHDEMHRLQRRLSHYLYEHFYNAPPLMKMGHRARRFLTGLFEAYREKPRLLEPEERAWAEEVGLERAICDKIAAMTDREAQEEYRSSTSPSSASSSSRSQVRWGLGVGPLRPVGAWG